MKAALPVHAEYFPASLLVSWVRETRERTFELVADLDDAAMRVPYRPILNPLLWEIGHIAWFQERWVLRAGRGRKALISRGDSFWDSANVEHTSRWELDLPSRSDTIAYLERVRDEVIEGLERGEPSADEVYYVLLSVFHEDMHAEAFTYMRQTLGYAPPTFLASSEGAPFDGDRAIAGDVEIPGGTWQLGSSPDEPFVFDNEKWEHPVEVAPFAISRLAVTQREFADFVDDDGYRRDGLWSAAGRRWRDETGAAHPLHWRREGSRWERRVFDHWIPLESDLPVCHVSWHEAEAFCRWAGRRLPEEAEWEIAAAAEPASPAIGAVRRRYPWGDDRPAHLEARQRANVHFGASGPCDVRALASSDSACGCRQLLGNVWEWTASTFEPFPGFSPDPYAEYSQPFFGSRKVLRGGSWATTDRLARNAYRNYFAPDRRDVFAGFRTCAIGERDSR